MKENFFCFVRPDPIKIEAKYGDAHAALFKIERLYKYAELDAELRVEMSKVVLAVGALLEELKSVHMDFIAVAAPLRTIASALVRKPPDIPAEIRKALETLDRAMNKIVDDRKKEESKT